jgi:hypothetical protein
MVDIVELRKTAKRLREWARQIRRESDATPYATSGEVILLLDKAAKGLEDACDEISRNLTPLRARCLELRRKRSGADRLSIGVQYGGQFCTPNNSLLPA